MTHTTGLLLLTATLSLFTGCAQSGPGVNIPTSPITNDPPDRVARISHLTGNVSLRLAGTDTWTTATLNRPLTTGDEIATSPGARAELHTGNAAIRLNSESAITLLEVSTNAIQIKLNAGTLSLHARDLDEGEEIEIDTPDAAIALLRTGEYRVEVAPSSPGTTVIARTGSAEVTGNNLSFVLRQNQQARIPGLDTQPYTVTSAPPTDSFDAFCRDRNQREDRALAAKHVSPRMIGYEDLDYYGDWQIHPSYGPLWYPRTVPIGWTPYGFGHWVWIEPWGWTWIDDTPWGFAPFHYGRWAYINARWGWIPGPFHRRPIYAPALVVFVGSGGPGSRVHFRIGVGFGVAWFPLGPHEIWFPPYRTSRTYVTNVNITHTVITNPATIHRTNIERQRYANQQIRNAITAVPEDAFRRAEPVQRRAIQVGPNEATRTTIAGHAPPTAPTRDSLSRKSATVPPPSAARTQRQVIVNRRPPATPVPFEQRRPALESTPGRVPPPTQSIPRPDVRQQPRQQQPTRQPAPTIRQPQTDQRRDQQWDRRTGREETRQKQRVETDRRQSPRPQPTPRRPD